MNIMKYFTPLIDKIIVLVFINTTCLVFAQKPVTQFNGFGHLEFTFNQAEKPTAFFSIGEHDFFVTSQIKKRISFLGEYVFRFNGKSASSYLPSIERSLLKFNYKGNHNVIVGKIHTPVNYWNDVYHHGRLFFPTIERPLAFSYIIPLHSLGAQMQGQNLGKLNFGYDLVVANGISSTDVFHNDAHMSLTAAVHFKPTEFTRLGISYYYDFLSENTPGAHSGHSASYAHYTGEPYVGSLAFQLTSLSIAHFSNKLEILSESSYNLTETDSLGIANNFSTFLYAGYIIKEKHVPYLLIDFIKIAKNDLYTHELGIYKFGLGYKHEFNHLLNVKAQLEYQRFFHGHTEHQQHENIGFKIQFAYGF